MQTYQFISLFSPSEVSLDENLRWVEDGFSWSWHDNANWWAYELSFDPDANDAPCGINDIIYSYGFESFISSPLDH
jgi:hypothetical protein